MKLIIVVLTVMLSVGPLTAQESLRYVGVYVDSEGDSHFADEKLDLNEKSLGPDFPTVKGSAGLETAQTTFFCFESGSVVDWHTSPDHQFYIILSGSLRLEVSDGEIRIFEPGSVISGEVTEGQGVRAHWAEEMESCVGVIALKNSSSVEEKLNSSLEQWIRGGFEFSWENGQPMPDEVRQVWSQLGRGGAGYGFRTLQARGDNAESNTNQTSQSLLANMEHWRVTLDELHTSVIDEIGLAWGVYNEEFKLKDQPPEAVRVRFTNTLRWDGQAWQNLLYHRDAQLFEGNGRQTNSIIERNKELVLTMNHEVWNEGNLGVIEELFSPEFVQHFLPEGSDLKGINALREEIKKHRQAFPDWSEQINHIVAEDDLVVIQFESSGTNLGSWLGNLPTGKKVKINEFSILRIENGKIAEQWLMPDLFNLRRQLGFANR